ncbi:MAG: zinc ribbon domain-containing protein [Gemmatimonadetes bacterium]|nr:MAG: zinc ribbon domain-containing protein [Gemmatimonadota bacterium]
MVATLVVIILLASVAGIYVVIPLFSPPTVKPKRVGEYSKWHRLQEQKTAVLQNLHDLDLEYQMGKIGEADYQELRQKLKAEAASVLSALDQVQQHQQWDSWIETEVRQRRQRSPGDGSIAESPTFEMNEDTPLTCTNCNHTNPPHAKFCSTCGTSLAQPTCPQCGASYKIGDNFCNQCGTPLTEKASSS